MFCVMRLKNAICGLKPPQRKNKSAGFSGQKFHPAVSPAATRKLTENPQRWIARTHFAVI
jgi:hypothetical protein